MPGRLLQAMDVHRPVAREAAASALESGPSINAPKPDALRFMPALNVRREEIDEMIRILANLLGRIFRQWRVEGEVGHRNGRRPDRLAGRAVTSFLAVVYQKRVRWRNGNVPSRKSQHVPDSARRPRSPRRLEDPGVSR